MKTHEELKHDYLAFRDKARELYAQTDEVGRRSVTVSPHANVQMTEHGAFVEAVVWVPRDSLVTRSTDGDVQLSAQSVIAPDKCEGSLTPGIGAQASRVESPEIANSGDVRQVGSEQTESFILPPRRVCDNYTRPEGIMGGPCLNCGGTQPEHAKQAARSTTLHFR